MEYYWSYYIQSCLMVKYAIVTVIIKVSPFTGIIFRDLHLRNKVIKIFS